MGVPPLGFPTAMTHRHSTGNGRTTVPTDPSWGAVLAMVVTVTATPVLAMVLLTHPTLGVGAILGLTARLGLALVGRLGWAVPSTANHRLLAGRVSAPGSRAQRE